KSANVLRTRLSLAFLELQKTLEEQAVGRGALQSDGRGFRGGTVLRFGPLDRNGSGSVWPRVTDNALGQLLHGRRIPGIPEDDGLGHHRSEVPSGVLGQHL